VQLSTKFMRDGTRLFISLPAVVDAETLACHLARLPGVEITETVDTAADAWILYSLDGRTFDVNAQFGEYLFVAQDPGTPDDVLRRIAGHANELLWQDPAVVRHDSRWEAWGGAVVGAALFGIASAFEGARQWPLLRILMFATGTTVGCIGAATWRTRKRATSLVS
jgi:hypothetical protein